MIKNIFIAASLFTAFVHGMEKENRWDVALYGTKIHVIQGEVLEYYAYEDKKIDIMICLGRNKQIELGPPYRTLYVGVCDGPYATLWFKPEKDSLHYARAQLNNWRFPKRNNVSFLCIGEPHVLREQGGLRYNPQGNIHYEGDEAIAKSYQDLALCYEKLLDEGIKVLQQQLKQDEDAKNIAFPMLGADFKYKNSYFSKEDTAPIAVTSIVEFIKNNHRAYNNLEFFVEDDADFNLYKKLLMEQCGLVKKICLLYCAKKYDERSLISLLPPELIDYIAGLI